MNEKDWKELEHLYELEAKGDISEADKNKLEDLFENTLDEEEHPEDFDWPCQCQLCMSYGY